MKYIVMLIAVSIQAISAPAIFNNEGYVTNLEKFSQTCGEYESVVKHPALLRKMCHTYDTSLRKAMKIGNKIETKMPQQTSKTVDFHGKQYSCTVDNSSQLPKLSEKKIKVLKDRYLKKLRELEAMKAKIVKFLIKEKHKAIKQDDVLYHERLIRNRALPLSNCDYVMMAKHENVYAQANNPRYRSFIEQIIDEQTKKEKLAQMEKRKHLLLQQKLNRLKKREKEIERRCGGRMTYDTEKGYIDGRVIGISDNMCAYIETSFPVEKLANGITRLDTHVFRLCNYKTKITKYHSIFLFVKSNHKFYQYKDTNGLTSVGRALDVSENFECERERSEYSDIKDNQVLLEEKSKKK